MYCTCMFCGLFQMCLRINNIHLLISIFPAFEAHLYSITLKDTRRPASTLFGYLSSDVGDHLSLIHPARLPSQYGTRAPLQSQVNKEPRGLLTTSSEHSLMPRGTCTCTLYNVYTKLIMVLHVHVCISTCTCWLAIKVFNPPPQFPRLGT